MSEAARENAVSQRIVPRNGKQAGAVRVMRDEERNPRSEFNANRRIAGQPNHTPEQQEILRRLSGEPLGARAPGNQRGSVQVMRDRGADSMLNEFHAKFPEEAPVGHSGKRIGKANVDLEAHPTDPSRVNVNMIHADQPGAGFGAGKQVLDLADKHGVTLQADPVPVGKGGPTREQLKDMYGKMGFKPDTEAPGATAHTMTREPRQVKGQPLGMRAPGNQIGAVGDLKLRRDNPGGEWLKNKQEISDGEGRNPYGARRMFGR